MTGYDPLDALIRDALVRRSRRVRVRADFDELARRAETDDASGELAAIRR